MLTVLLTKTPKAPLPFRQRQIDFWTKPYCLFTKGRQPGRRHELTGVRRPQLSREKPLILVVAAYPEPCDRIALENANSTVPQSYPHGPDVFFSIYAFEVQ
jgi:hypothetical protein